MLGAHRLKSALMGVGDASTMAARAIGFGVVNMLGYKLKNAMDGAINFLKRGMNEFKKVESQSLQMVAILGLTPEAVDKITNSFENLAVKLPLSTSELMNMTTELIRTGAFGAKAFTGDMKEVLDTTKSLVNFSKLAGTSMAETGSIMGVLGLQMAENANDTKNMAATMQHLSEVITKVGASSAANARFIMRGAQRVLATAKAYGVASEEALMFLGISRSAGMEAMTAGNNLSVVIEALNAPKNTFRLAKIMGTTSYELKQLKKENPTRFFLNTMESLRRLTRSGEMSGGELTAMFKQMGLGNRRALALIRSITGSAKSFKRMREEIKTSKGTFEDMTEAWKDSLIGLQSTLKGTIDILASQFAKTVVNTFKEALAWINKTLGAFREYLAENPKVATAITLVILLTAGITTLMGSILVLTAGLGFLWIGLANVANMLAATDKGFRVARRAAGKGGNVLRIYADILKRRVVKNLMLARKATYDYTQEMLFNNAVTGHMMTGGGTRRQRAMDLVRSGGSKVKSGAGSAVAGIAGMGAALISPAAWKKGFGGVLGFLKKIIPAMGTFVKSIASGAKAFASMTGWIGIILAFFDIIIGFVKGAFDSASGSTMLGKGWDNFVEGIGAVLIPIWHLIKGLGKILFQVGMLLGQSIVMKAIWASLGAIFWAVGWALKFVGVVFLAILGIFDLLIWAVEALIMAFQKLQNAAISTWNLVVPGFMEADKVEEIEFSSSIAANAASDMGLAQGGIATKPTRRTFGEAGPEAVMPLNRMAEMISDAVYAALEGVMGGQGTGGGDIVIPITVTLDGEKLGMMEERVRARDNRRQMGGGNIALNGIG